jgi:hypothetical protein
MTEFHLPAQCEARLGFKLRAKPIRIDEKRQGNQDKKNDCGPNPQNEQEALFHMDGASLLRNPQEP